MTKTEKANQILLAIYDELGKGQFEKIDRIYNWEKNKGRLHAFSKQLPKKKGIQDYLEFCQLMLELCEEKFITAEVLDEKYIKGGYKNLLDKRLFHFYDTLNPQTNNFVLSFF